MIDRLKDNYYKITPEELKPNTARMNSPDNINKLLKQIIDQIKTVIDFCDAKKVPITLEMVVAMACNLILVAGYFINDCRRWNQKTDVDKTWTDYKSYFVE